MSADAPVPGITREEIERLRHAIDDPRWLLVLAAAESPLSHPAALERARAEERERCAQHVESGWRENAPPGKYSHDGDLVEAYTSGTIDACVSITAALRALGPRPSPEAEAPGHPDLMVPPETLDAFMAANPLPPEPAGDGWIVLGGGVPPVDSDERVRVRFPDGEETEGEAGDFEWDHAAVTPSARIIAYRLSPPSDLAGKRS